MRTEELKRDWNDVVEQFSMRFGGGEEMDIDGIIFVLGVQEAGFGYKKFKKHEKVDIMHIAICRLLEPYGYYTFSGVDEQGWPHYEVSATLPFLKTGEQTVLMKEAIVNYCKENGWLTPT